MPKKAVKPSKPKPQPKGKNYELGYLYGQLGNAIKAALADKSVKKGK